MLDNEIDASEYKEIKSEYEEEIGKLGGAENKESSENSELSNVGHHIGELSNREIEDLELVFKLKNVNNQITSGPKVDFNLLKCEGDSKQQKLTVVFTVLNHDANKYLSISKADAIDLEANQYHTTSTLIGSSSVINTVYTETPVKATVEFSQILPSVKMLKLVSIPYALGNQVNLAFEFRDIPVTWK